MKHARLPTHVKPERYKLLIKPDLESFTFEGEETISLIIKKPTGTIVLHAKELSIYDVKFQISKSKFQIKNIGYDRKTETATFVFARKLHKGKGHLSLKFKGILSDNMRGFYRSHYFHLGQKKHIATTQFEATDARRAFPCFDEPAQKAIFDVTIMVPPGLTAISNTVESSIKEHESGYRVVQFEPTPKMSTYLLAFIVGDFEYIEGKTKTGIAVRIFVTPGKKHQARFALDCAIKILEFYSQYFGIPYPLPILDLIAIPDFSHGAMENWGAVTYRESALLVDPEHTSAANKQWVALVIAHELAHQWFGNLVTMRWWTDLWLNEGFASYIEYLAVDHIFPTWDIWTQFAYNDLGVALKLDALKSTHPIEIEVSHPDEIGEIFDEVSYSKGASVIRMLASYLGQKVFQKGLRHYLKRHSYQNAETQDLWKAFEKVSRKPIRKIMENWTKKGGYPVVRIIDEPTQFKLVQSRFFSNPISKKLTADKTSWTTPLSYLTGKSNQIYKTDLTRRATIIPKPVSDWVKFNFKEESVVRIDYPAQILEKLKQPIKNKKLPAIDRLGVIRDAFALAESGDLPTPQALELCEAYESENNYTVWVEILTNLNALDNLFFGQNCHENFRKFARKLLFKITKIVGWKARKNESHTRSLLRSLILQADGSFGDKSVISHAKQAFSRWVAKNVLPAPDLRAIIYNLSAENSGFREYWFLIKRYKRETLHEEKNRIGRALGKFKDDRLIAKTLEFALSKEVRYQDTAGLFNSAWSNPYGKMKTWEFTKKHWKILLKRYPSSGHMLSRFIKPASLFTSLKQAEEVKSFFKKHKAPGTKRTIDQVLEKIHVNHLWLKRDLNKIENWLKNNSN